MFASRVFISIKRQRCNEAIGHLTQAIILDPRDSNLYLNRGGAYAVINVNEMALLDITNAIRLNSRLALAYFNNGSIHERMGSFTLLMRIIKKPAIWDSSRHVLQPK